MNPITQPEYNLAQLNHIRQLYANAQQEHPTLTHSGFMMLYFRFNIDADFRKYWHGEKHMPKWEDVKKRTELTDLLKELKQ